MHPPSDKSELRSNALKKRAGIAASDHRAWSEAACGQLIKTVRALPHLVRKIAFYSPLPSELDVMPALAALAEDYVILLPAVEKETLAFHAWEPGQPSRKGAFGITEAAQQTEPVAPDAVIVPLVAFDKNGHRLGWGKGYYDRALLVLRAKNPALLAIGIAFAVQEESSLPADAHDEKLDMIVTEKELIVV